MHVGQSMGHSTKSLEAPQAVFWLAHCHQTLAGLHHKAAVPAAGAGCGPDVSWSTASDLGSVVLEYALRSRDAGCLGQAIELLRQACDAGPDAGPPRIVNATRLAVALCTRFERDGNQADLDAAIATLQRAEPSLLAASGAECGECARLALRLLARALRRRFELTGSTADLEAAAEAAEAVAAPGPGPDRGRREPSAC